MTVIAFKDGIMAADTQVTIGTQRYRVQKLVRLPCGGVAGAAGDSAAGQAALVWFRDGGSLNGPTEKDALPDVDGATVLVAKADGTRWILVDHFPAWEVMDPEVAIGCAADGARERMVTGASAVEACEAMCERDAYCSSPVQSMAVEPTREYSAAVTHKPKRK